MLAGVPRYMPRAAHSCCCVALQVMEALAKIQAGEKFDAVSTHARRNVMCTP